MSLQNLVFTPEQVRQILLSFQAQGVDVGEFRLNLDGTLSFVAQLAGGERDAPRPRAGKRASLRQIHDLPEGVRFQRKTLGDGSVVRYGYFGRGKGEVALGRFGTPAFDAAVARLRGSASAAPREGTVAALIDQYKHSADFSRLRDATKRDYRRWLDQLLADFGERTFAEIEARTFTTEVFAWRDKRARSPRQADYGVQVLKILLSWACRRGLIDTNRASHIDKLHRSGRRARSWSDGQVRAFLAKAPPNLQLALMLALETGQRQGDLLRLRWEDIEDGVLHLRQSKTGAVVAVPISQALQACLDTAPGDRRGLILRSASGEPWKNPGCSLRSAWRHVTQRAGIGGVTFHDLRGTFVTRKLSEGWSPTEVAMCTGHALRDLASLDIYADRKVIARRVAERLMSRSPVA